MSEQNNPSMGVHGRASRVQHLMLYLGVLSLLALHSVAASARVVVGTWRLDVDRSELNSDLNAFRDTFRQRMTISLVNGSVRIDLLSTGVPRRGLLKLALTPGCCPGGFGPRPPVLSEQFADSHLYVMDGMSRAFNTESDGVAPPKGVRLAT